MILDLFLSNFRNSAFETKSAWNKLLFLQMNIQLEKGHKKALYSDSSRLIEHW